MSQFNKTARLSEALGELNYSGLRKLGYDKVLLVEGVTEVKVLWQWLSLYDKRSNVVILPLGGSQFISADREEELAEITRIAETVVALIDSERDAESEELSPSHQAFKSTCEELKIACHVLDRRATENYLADHAVKKEKGAKYAELGPFERRRDAKRSWPKADNSRIARWMKKEDLASTDLGRFLEGL